jgi:hypothetical protein
MHLKTDNEIDGEIIMIIDNSHIQLSSEHQRSEQFHYSASLQGFMQALGNVQQRRSSSELSAAGQLRRQDTPAAAKGPDHPAPATPIKLLPSALHVEPGQKTGLELLSPIQDNGINITSASFRLFQSLLQTLIGQIRPLEQLPEMARPAVTQEATAPTVAPETVRPDRARQGIAIDLRINQRYREFECTRFSACGLINTRDGRQLNFDLNLTMSRTFESSRQIDARQVTLKDPLVINFDGQSTELSDEKFEFDLDADGEQELIHFVDANSGLLAWDSNEDGLINHGSELFGTQSGNGFADLAKHDQDGNGFIDEADSIFEQLKIWTKLNGEDRLESLKQRDIGALYLGATRTPFEIKDGDNQLQAKVQRSGIYLNENGDTGTLQQLDLVV